MHQFEKRYCMIQISGITLQQSDRWRADAIESTIIRRMNDNPTVYSYQSIDELAFELGLRKNIIVSARAMDQSNVKFAAFKNSRCNSEYWNLTNVGGFLLRRDVKPSNAIQDIYLNSSQYAFECATAMIIIYYHAVLNLIGEASFNQLFQSIYLYSWHFDSDLGLRPYATHELIPGDVAYFNNPDFNPQTPHWRGENAVVLEDGMYFGHGIGIKTAEQMIDALNKRRKAGSHRLAYLTTVVSRPSFTHLWNSSVVQRGYSIAKSQQLVDHHNESSISLYQYLFL